MKLRLMLFDLWGTLIFDDPGVVAQRQRLRVRSAAETLRRMGFDYDPIDIATAFDAADQAHGRIHADALDISAHARTVLYIQHLDDALGERIDEAGWACLDEAILTPALDLPPSAIPGATDALADVKALGLPIGLVSVSIAVRCSHLAGGTLVMAWLANPNGDGAAGGSGGAGSATTANFMKACSYPQNSAHWPQ